MHNNEIIAYWFDSKYSEETGHFEYIVREVYGPSFSIGDDCMVGTHGQEVKGIPSRRVSFGNPHERLFACLTIVSKMYLDKIILVREQIKLSELGSSSSFQLPDCFTVWSRLTRRNTPQTNAPKESSWLEIFIGRFF